jgi:hypothetical protein
MSFNHQRPDSHEPAYITRGLGDMNDWMALCAIARGFNFDVHDSSDARPEPVVEGFDTFDADAVLQESDAPHVVLNKNDFPEFTKEPIFTQWYGRDNGASLAGRAYRQLLRLARIQRNMDNYPGALSLPAIEMEDWNGLNGLYANKFDLNIKRKIDARSVLAVAEAIIERVGVTSENSRKRKDIYDSILPVLGSQTVAFWHMLAEHALATGNTASQ